jgi:curved DNA-binding protein CbpA
LDHYQTLGVSPRATPDEIKRAYRRLVKLHHPDLNKSPGAEEMTRRINRAFEVLGDPDERRLYDASLASVHRSSSPTREAGSAPDYWRGADADDWDEDWDLDDDWDPDDDDFDDWDDDDDHWDGRDDDVDDDDDGEAAAAQPAPHVLHGSRSRSGTPPNVPQGAESTSEVDPWEAGCSGCAGLFFFVLLAFKVIYTISRIAGGEP